MRIGRKQVVLVWVSDLSWNRALEPRIPQGFRWEHRHWVQAGKTPNITDPEVTEAPRCTCGQQLQLVEKKTKGSRQLLSLRKKNCG